MAAYVILGISCEGKKDVLTIEVGDNESAKYWLAVLNSLKNRGVKDILIICADWDPRGNPDGFPEDRISALYRPPGPEHVKIRVRQRPQGLRQ